MPKNRLIGEFNLGNMTKLFSKNNTMLVDGAIAAGCTHFFGYPITPQNEIIEGFAAKLPGAGGVFLQSESELSGINMVAGCASTGARVLISSSGPGLSLMQEGLSYMACAEIPCVVVNVMRAGPGDGDIRGAQADYFQATRGGGHGDYCMPVFTPASGSEIFSMVREAFDKAFHYRTPVLLLMDGLLGQMIEAAEVSVEAKKTTEHPAWSVRGCKGREPNCIKSYFNDTEDCEAFNKHLQAKFAQMRKDLPDFEAVDVDDADLVITSYGIISRICKTVVKAARAEGYRVGYIRPKLVWPFPEGAYSSVGASNILVVEQSAGQMLEDVKLSAPSDTTVHFYGRLGGAVPSVNEILAQVRKIMD
jgi:2-oxoglutarate ferredoxin oxidoreductase subunit alpha